MKVAARKKDMHLLTDRRFLAGMCFLLLILMTSTNTFADPLTLQQVLPRTVGPQNANDPCIIAGTMCQNPDGFDWEDYDQRGNISEYTVSSPVYAINDFEFRKFNVAIDVNTAQNGEVLDYFNVVKLEWDEEDNLFKEVGTLYSYDKTSDKIYQGNIGILPSNGNGFADWILGEIKLPEEGVDYVRFDAKWSSASGGAESFFIVGPDDSDLYTDSEPNSVVPEPATVLLLGAGLAGLSLLIYRKKKS